MMTLMLIRSSGNGLCQCGKTMLLLRGAPLLNATCYCNSCRTAARNFERELGAPQTVTKDGGVEYSSWRKDRMAKSGFNTGSSTTTTTRKQRALAITKAIGSSFKSA